MKAFLQKNYVFVSGLISAIILVLQQAIAAGQTDYKAIGFAILIACLGIIANQWKGKGLTATGLIGTVAGAFITVQQNGHTTWNEIFLASLLAVMTTISSGMSAYKPEGQ